MQEFINRAPSVKTKCIFFCVEDQKDLAYHLEGLRVPVVVCVPQFGNHCHRRIQDFFRGGVKDEFIRMCTDCIPVKTQMLR